MDEILASVNIDSGRSIHIAQLSRQTIIDGGAEHLGFGGYYLFEVVEEGMQKGINILGKTPSIDAALYLSELFQQNFQLKAK